MIGVGVKVGTLVVQWKPAPAISGVRGRGCG